MLDIEGLEKIFGILDNVFTIVGIIVGALWTYNLFVKNRQIYPRADIEHHVSISHIPNKEYSILTILVNFKNSGQVLLKVKSYVIEIQELFPFDDNITNQLSDTFSKNGKFIEIANGKFLHKVKDEPTEIIEMEPSEKEQFPIILIISNELKGIIVKSHFKNIKKERKHWFSIERKSIGWNNTTTHFFENIKA